MKFVAMILPLLTTSASPAPTPGSLFNCPKLSAVADPGDDISKLHPSHVSVMMAVGDSITAAFAAKNGIKENRDISWSIGDGDAGQLTLPWMMGQYSDKIEGSSHASVLPVLLPGLPKNDYHGFAKDGLNVAESSGAANSGSVDEQWNYLKKNVGKISDFQNRWKVLTYWMFANDVTPNCNLPFAISPMGLKWESKTSEFLTNVVNDKRFRRTYINLVGMIDLSQIHRIQSTHLECAAIHAVINEAGCVDKGTDAQRRQLDANVHAMNARLHKFASDWREKLQQMGRTDIAIVMQPFAEGVGKTLTRSFLSNTDCFHPSKSAHQSLAVGLWNSMLCTSDRETLCNYVFAPNVEPTCPTEQSVFYTGPDAGPRTTGAEGWDGELVNFTINYDGLDLSVTV